MGVAPDSVMQTSDVSAPGQLEAQFPHSPAKKNIYITRATLVWILKINDQTKNLDFSYTVDMESKDVGVSGAPWLRESSSCGARVVNLAFVDKRELAFCPTDCSTSCHAL